MPERQQKQFSRKHRWNVQGRVAVLEYSFAHGVKPDARAVRPRPQDRAVFGLHNEEFWSRPTFGSFAEAAGALCSWERRYNTGFSMALQGRTRTEKLAALPGIAA